MQEITHIRKASLNDFERIADLEITCFTSELAYTRRQLRYLLTKANSTVLVETISTIVRGFIIILYRKGTRVAGIETINVDPVYRKQGVGLRLLNAAEECVRKKGIHKIRLEVSTTNRAAVMLYENAGFKKTALLKNYYLYNHDGSRDAFRMIKELV
jgi:ribosomal protein S18 acetylase RimI-like enzyme